MLDLLLWEIHYLIVEHVYPPEGAVVLAYLEPGDVQRWLVTDDEGVRRMILLIIGTLPRTSHKIGT